MNQNSNPQSNLICKQHNKPQVFICLDKQCQTKIGCSKCFKSHDKLGHFTYSIEEVLDFSMIQSFNQSFSSKFWELAGKIRNFVINMEEVYVKYLEIIFHQLQKCLSNQDYFVNITHQMEYRFQRIFLKESKCAELG